MTKTEDFGLEADGKVCHCKACNAEIKCISDIKCMGNQDKGGRSRAFLNEINAA